MRKKNKETKDTSEYRKLFGREESDKPATHNDITKALDAVFDTPKVKRAEVDQSEQDSPFCPACDARALDEKCDDDCDCEVREQGCCGDGSPCRECRDTEKAYVLEKMKKELDDYTRKAPKRRVLVEELKSVADSADGGIGETNTVKVAYEYANETDNGNFRTSDKPVRVTVEENINPFNSLSSRGGNSFSKLQLKAHIKNLEAILSSLS